MAEIYVEAVLCRGRQLECNAVLYGLMLGIMLFLDCVRARVFPDVIRGEATIFA